MANENEKTLRLEKVIDRLNKTIEDLNTKLKDSERMKSNFISNVMNEIYNPFSSILSLSQNIMSVKDADVQFAKDMAEVIYEEAATLDFDLKNIFSAARIEAGMEVPRISKMYCGEIIFEVVNSCQLLAKKKNVDIEVIETKESIQAEIKSDPAFVRHVLSNVLHNAIKFSPANGKVGINFKLSEDKLQLKVLDQGPGISEEDKHRIFDRFKKLDVSVNSINSGYGLGLSVAQALVDLLNGTVEALNDEENGTCILIQIPNQVGIGNTEITDDDDDDLFDEEIF